MQGRTRNIAVSSDKSYVQNVVHKLQHKDGELFGRAYYVLLLFYV